MKICANAQRIDEDGNQIPHNYRPRQNQQSVVNPQNLEDAHDRGHAWVHSGGGTTTIHGDQVREGGKGCAKASKEAEDLRPLKSGNEQALRVACQVLTATHRD